MTRGTTLELMLTGTNLGAPTALIGAPGKVEFLHDEKKTSDKAIKLKLTVAADAAVGLVPIRLACANGLSNLRFFCVDDLPQVLDDDKNHDKSKPQQIPIPCVVSGRTTAEQGSFFRFTVAAGQRLSFEVLGRRIGSPIDPQLTLYHGKSLREFAFDNDSPGCQGDPRISYHFKEAGEYVAEVRDVLGRGGAEYVYRLRIGDFPMATSPIPMAAKAGSKVSVEFVGPMVDGVKAVEVAVPDDPPGSAVFVTPRGPSGLAGWPVTMVVSDVAESIEVEPNPDAAHANRMTVPGGVTGRFPPGDDADVFVVAGKKGQKLTIEAQTLEWGSPTLVYFVVRNAKAEIARSNPSVPPPGDQRVEVTPAEDGDLFIEVQPLLFRGGPADAYHLSVRPVTPSFEVNLTGDRTESAPGGVALLPFTIARKGFTGPIEVFVRGEPSIATNLKAGQTGGLLRIPVALDAKFGGKTLSLSAKAMIDGKAVLVLASAKAIVSKAMSDLPYPPLAFRSLVDFAVKEAAPFRLAVAIQPADAAPGTVVTATVTATRTEGFAQEITINPPTGLPPMVGAPKIGPIPKGKTETKFTLDVNAKTPIGDYFMLLTGKAKVEGRDVLSDPVALALAVGAPFDLAVEPGKLEIAAGGKATLKITATRKAGYKGPITITFKKLPAKVTAATATIAADKTSVDVEFTAAGDAAPVARVEVEAVGTATGLNNLTGSTPLAVLVRAKTK
ncbi:MAG TPA: PPC domain-containing protein [Gemmataceae bacterium]|nr:PPC domain-containing protein [Gemmataceae bacterium]